MASTVSGVLSCRLPSLSHFCLAYSLWHSKKKQNFWFGFCLHFLKVRELGRSVPQVELAMQGTSLHFAATVRSGVDAVGLVPDCAAAFSTYADVPGFPSQVD